MKDLWKDYKRALFDILPLTEEETWADWKGKKLNLTAKTYSGRYILKSREAEIWGDKSCIYNNIIYPNTEPEYMPYGMPCFGMDLMGFFEKKVIIVFDFQHPKPNYLFETKFLRRTYTDIRFFEPGNHFSSHAYVVKCTADEVQNHLETFKDYLRVYTHLLYSNRPEGKTIDRYANFDKYMRDLDPVAGYLKSNFGEEKSEDFVNNFLFTY
jgi:hypothetical protein